MSMITSVFHTYGFLITDDAANRILQYVKKTSPALYERFSDSESELSFQEYLSEEYDGCQYGTADYMTVWRIKDREELDLNPGDQFYILELEHFPQLFSQAYASYEEVVRELQEKLGNLLPPDFPFDNYLVEIMGEVWG